MVSFSYLQSQMLIGKRLGKPFGIKPHKNEKLNLLSFLVPIPYAYARFAHYSLLKDYFSEFLPIDVSYHQIFKLFLIISPTICNQRSDGKAL